MEKEREKLPCAGMILLVLIPVTPSGVFPFPFALPTPWPSLLPREGQESVREPASSPRPWVSALYPVSKLSFLSLSSRPCPKRRLSCIPLFLATLSHGFCLNDWREKTPWTGVPSLPPFFLPCAFPLPLRLRPPSLWEGGRREGGMGRPGRVACAPPAARGGVCLSRKRKGAVCCLLCSLFVGTRKGFRFRKDTMVDGHGGESARKVARAHAAFPCLLPPPSPPLCLSPDTLCVPCLLVFRASLEGKGKSARPSSVLLPLPPRWRGEREGREGGREGRKGGGDLHPRPSSLS